MAVVFMLASEVFSPVISVVLALISRLLVTGALHEDGLADFCDGFGGGTDRERTLAIMKDSHIGSYGVIGLIMYFLLLTLLISGLPLSLIAPTLLTADTWSKFTASHLINVLPYARKASESKARIVYERMTLPELFVAFVGGCASMTLLFPLRLWVAGLAPFIMLGGLYLLMRRRLGGYTGDCCGAAFLLCELTFYFGLHILLTL